MVITLFAVCEFLGVVFSECKGLLLCAFHSWGRGKGEAQRGKEMKTLPALGNG